jgi:hypothetical protein
MIAKQRYVKPAAFTLLAGSAVIRRVRKQRKEAAHPRGFRRMGRWAHR